MLTAGAASAPKLSSKENGLMQRRDHPSSTVRRRHTPDVRRSSRRPRVAASLLLAALACLVSMSPSSSHATVAGTKRIVVFLVTSEEFPVESRYPWTKAEVERAFFGGRGSGSLAEFMDHGSNGALKITGEVRDWQILPWSSTPTHCVSSGQLPSVSPPPDYRFVVFPFSPVCDFHGDTSGYLNGSISLRLLAHEIGHAFGFSHDRAEGINLAEAFDPMGGSSGECGYHARHKVALGWIPGGPPDITTAGVFQLRSSDLPPDNVTPQILTVRAPIPGTSFEATYFLETRQRDPARAFTGCMLKEPPVNGVLVRFQGILSNDLQDYNANTPTFADAAIPVGNAMVTKEGIRIEVQSLSSSGATVAISFVSPPLVDARIVGRELVVTGTSENDRIGVAPITAPEVVPKRFEVGGNRLISPGPGCTSGLNPTDVICEASSPASDITAVTIDLGAGDDLFRAAGWFPLTVLGGPGDDTLDEVTFSNGSTVFQGGSGIDTVDYSGRDIGAEVSLDGVANDGYAGPTFQAPGGVWWIQEFDNIGTDVEVVKGTQGDDTIVAGTAPVVIEGNGGDDVLQGGPSGDVIDGGAGDDVLVGLAGPDTLNGGAGIDTVDYTGRATPVSIVGDWLPNDGESGELDNVGADVEQALPGTIAVMPMCQPGSTFAASSLKVKYRKVVQGRASKMVVQGTVTTKANTSGETPFGARMLIEELDSGKLTRLMDFQPPATPFGSGCGPRDGWKSSSSAIYRLFSNRIDPPACTLGSGNGLKFLKLIPRPGNAMAAKLQADPTSLSVPSGRFRLTLVEGSGVGGLTAGKCAQSPPMACARVASGSVCSIAP